MSGWQWVAVAVIVAWAFTVALILRILYVVDNPPQARVVDEAERIVRRAFQRSQP